MKSSASMDSWRDYFRRADSDIFEIIDHAIMVAAADCPKVFKSRRDRIAELLFSCRVSRCTGCDHLELSVPGDDEAIQGRRSVGNRGGGDMDDRRRGGGGLADYDDDGEDDYDGFEVGGSNSSRGDNQIVNNYSYGEAEALSDEIDEASEIEREVKRLKKILLNSEDEPNSVLFESLRKLQLMGLSVDILKSTEIGKAVNGLRKHGSERIRLLAKTLIAEWKDLVDRWVSSAKEIAGAECTPDSANPSVVDEEEGLPSPPLDEVAFFTTEPTGLELSQFFDGMDFDGNPRNCVENHENQRRPQNTIKRRPQAMNEPNIVARDNKTQQMKRQEAPARSMKSSAADLDISRKSQKQNTEPRMKKEVISVQKSEKPVIQKKPFAVEQQKRKALGARQDKLKGLDEDAKFEFTKRKLQESYQQHENAKRQRTIQVLETIPKQGQKPQLKRPGLNNRHWASGRR